MRQTLLTVAILAIALSAAAEDPPRYTWVSRSCSDWNCVMLEMTWAQGDPSILILQTTSQKAPWVVLQRLDRNSAYVPSEDQMYIVERYDDLESAGQRFQIIAKERAPLLITSFEGSVLVVYLRVDEVDTGRKRSVRH